MTAVSDIKGMHALNIDEFQTSHQGEDAWNKVEPLGAFVCILIGAVSPKLPNHTCIAIL